LKTAGVVASVLLSAAGPSLPYTPGIFIDGTLYADGQTGTDLKTNKIPENSSRNSTMPSRYRYT